jgi:hypothetical protein
MGKSWMALQFCLNISQQKPVWDCETSGKSVLYFCLEDSYRRIRRRIDQLDEMATRKLHFLNTAPLLHDGLEKLIERHVQIYPDTKFIVIDTLQMVRGAEVGTYAGDYADMRIFKMLADRLGITILFVHHNRKKKDDDPFNMISGTTGLTGTADGSFVLFRDKIGQCKLAITGRDIEQRTLDLDFDPDTCHWEMLSCDAGVYMPNAAPPEVIFAVCDHVKSVGNFKGSATELLTALGNDETPANTLTKALNTYTGLLTDNGILYEFHRTGKKKFIELTYCA